MSICTGYCDGCRFRYMIGGTFVRCCNYYFVTNQRRPCPAGDGCTVRMARKEDQKREYTPEEAAAFAEKQKAKEREYNRAYYEKNKARLLASNKKWKEANREHLREYRRRYRKKRKEKEE